MTALVIAEHRGGQLAASARRAVSAARRLDAAVELLVIGGEEAAAAAEAAAAVEGVERVLCCAGEAYAAQLAEPLAARVAELAEQRGYTAVLAAASSLAKDFLPRVAAALDVAMLSDVTAIEDAETFQRPLYGGSVIARLRCREPVRVMTVRGTAFPGASDGGEAPVERLEPGAAPALSRLLEERLSDSGRPELTAARVVVAGGRGLRDEAGVRELEALADQLGAAIGATRGAVDDGLLPSDAQVGLTAKVVAPELYIAVGLSGAIYHVSGMKDSRVVVAINTDEEAPIMQLADYALAADLFEALPRLRRALAADS
ncbi:electron transfer flavoprotein subunit alpha/FixB family protein [Halorhodospira neutriphila]|uniref:Electron transfer flavoprotein subunit alpha n=1 Tax=Halorhodospira neutriphila TaxID=168379 RepID=A0ABS1E4Z2_9GAMM|nr:FAD-binding protein [Halorhodospira neutriphila]MBK1726810.1 electron transfer flavoprotein subunit alpha [Halorhodospira neutriphila]